MNLSNRTCPDFNKLSVRLLLTGMFLLLYGAPQTAHAVSSSVDLFATTTGSGSTCSQAVPCTLQTALANSFGGDIVYVAGGNYTGSGNEVVKISKSITLYGGWDGTTTVPPVRDPKVHPTTIDGEDARRGIHISGNISPVIDGLRVTRGNASGLGGYEYPVGVNTYDAGGGVYVSLADVTLINTVIADSSAEYGGGVFLNDSPGTLAYSTISGNTVTGGGGGVFAYKNAPTLSNNSITSNTSSNIAGGLYLFSTTASLQKNMITDNETFRNGGGVTVASCSPVFAGNIIARNKADYGAGITLLYSYSTFVNNVIVDNQLLAVSGRGSAMQISASSFEMKHTTFARNSGGDGSGIFMSKGSSASTDSYITLTNSIIAGHTVGVYVDTGSQLTHDGTLWGSGAWANTNNWDGGGTINTGTISISGNPAFADPDNGNYHISVDSAAIDAGVNAGIAEDIDGDDRPQNKGYDIGADEYPGAFSWNMFLPAITKPGQL